MDQAALTKAFEQARLKINRSHRHLQEAHAIIVAYLQSDFCRVVSERHGEFGPQTFRVESSPLPPELALAIGDCFHNLSAALDYVMTGMARAANISTTRISFPTNESRKALRQSFRAPTKASAKTPPNRRIMEAFPSLVMLLLCKIKPYPGGRFFLWEIRKTDNIDKHNLIVPTVGVTALRGISAVDRKYNNQMSGVECVIDAGGSFSLMHYGVSGGHMEITNKGQPSVSITFSNGMEVFGGQPVLPTMLQCIQAIDQALALIEASGVKQFQRS